MRDATGGVQSVLVLGGASDIAVATVQRLVADRCRRVVLAGRPSPALDAAAERLRGDGADVETIGFDAAEIESHAKVVGEVFAAGDVDVVLLAFGVLGDQAAFDDDHAAAADAVTVNYSGAVSAGLAVADCLRAQGHGTLVVLSSVAGERVRKDNFVYGSTKAGLDGFAQGLGDALQGSGARVMVVRPGFVATQDDRGHGTRHRSPRPRTGSPPTSWPASGEGPRRGLVAGDPPGRVRRSAAPAACPGDRCRRSTSAGPT